MNLYFINNPLRPVIMHGENRDLEKWRTHKKEWNKFKQFCNAVNAGTKESFDFDLDGRGFIARSVHDSRYISYDGFTDDYCAFENMVSKCRKYADDEDRTPLNEKGEPESYQAILYDGKSLNDAIASFNKGSLLLKKRPYLLMW